MKVTNAELMFNKQLIQYQIFIKNTPAKTALQRAFLPCNLSKCAQKYEPATQAGSKAPIQLMGRGRSCLAQLLNLGCLC